MKKLNKLLTNFWNRLT